MKQNSFFTILLLASSFFVYGQSSDQKAIRQILKEITAANTSGNYAALDHIYSSDFIFIDRLGKKFDKTERMAYLKVTPHPESFAFTNEQIRMYGTTAVVTTEVNIKPKEQEAQTYLTTIVMVKKGGRWQEVSVQSTAKVTNQ